MTMCEKCGNPAHSLEAQLVEAYRERNAEVRVNNAVVAINQRLAAEVAELKRKLANVA
jgi:hypothetical protein